MNGHIGSGPPVVSLAPLDEISPDRLLELERFAEIGRVSAGLLHEISSPLTAAMLWLEQYGNQQSIHIRRVRRSIGLLQRYVEAARQQVRRESQYRNFHVQPELEQVRHVLAPLAKRRGVKLQFAAAAGHTLYGDPVKFQQIIANLVNNAIDAYGDTEPGSAGAGNGAMGSPGKPRLVRLGISARRGLLTIEVSDKGCGISSDQLAHLFEPFYTTKSNAGLGLGIGLSVVKRYIETDFKGSITVKSSVQRGTRLTVTLPTAQRTR